MKLGQKYSHVAYYIGSLVKRLAKIQKKLLGIGYSYKWLCCT